MKKILSVLAAAAMLFAAGMFAACSDGGGSGGDNTVHVSSVSLDKTEAKVSVGKYIGLTATVLPKNATNKALVWESSNESIATVDNGVVKAKKEGSVTITATSVDGSKSAACSVTVTPADSGDGEDEPPEITQPGEEEEEPETPAKVSVTDIEINGNGIVAVGGTVTLSATVSPANASNKGVTYTTDSNAVKIEGNKLTGVSASESVTVTATAKDGSGVTATKVFRVVDASSISSGITIKAQGGWLEAAFVEWEENADCDNYNVYVASVGSADWKKLDKELIRKYPDCWRADALGLSEGKYQFKVVGTLGGAETNSTATSSEVDVIKHDRSGFGFSDKSPLKTSSGAYNDDGTLRDGAVVVYVTNDNAKTVKATIGKVEATGFQDIVYAKQKAENSSVILDIRIVGTVYAANMDSFGSSAEGLQIKGAKARQNMNLTIEGVGKDAGIHGFGMLIRNCGNVELRNFAVMDCMDDSISVDTDNCNLWIHNLDLYYGQAGGDADQKKGDGTIDIKLSQYCTVSYNHYWDSGKASLLDASEQTSNWVDYITFHHNWFDHSDSRHPRMRNGNAFHIYNNYYDGNAKYGMGSAVGASAFAENNYFRNCKLPMITGMQGHDLDASNKSTLSSEKGGIIKSYGNTIVGGTITWYSADSSNFDAYDAAAKDTVVPDNVKGKSGKSYSNFDTDSSIMYAYTPDTAEVAKDKTIAYSGRIGGGDLRWTFDSSEDTNYAVIPAFKTAVVGYKTTLVSTNVEVGSSGGDDTGDTGNTGDDDDDKPLPTGAAVISWSSSSATTDARVSSSGGKDYGNNSTQSYNGTTYRYGVKLNSSGYIRLSLEKSYTVSFYLGTDKASYSKGLKIDGTVVTPTSSNIVTATLAAGEHEIKQADSETSVYLVILQ